jgi:signal transduction histidine kinase
LYRIVQESLTNAGRHAPGARCVVRVDVGPPLRVNVDSEGGTTTTQSGDGLGLAGMAERASALGGSLQAGRHGDGWRVAATIP